MIPNYPLFGFPNYLKYTNNNNNRMPLGKRTNFTHNSQDFTTNGMKKNLNNITISNKKINSNTKTFSNTTTKTNFSTNTLHDNTPQQKKNCSENVNSVEKPIINIFGINLYFDDILIICLIFFLYNEKVTDYYLFFVLILLLMT